MANPVYADLITAAPAGTGDPRAAIANFLDAVQTAYDALPSELQTFKIQTNEKTVGSTQIKVWTIRALYELTPGGVKDEP